MLFPVGPVAKDRWGIRESVVSEEVIPMVKEVSRIAKTSVIDLYTPFEGKHNLIPDGVHPNGAGATIIAQAVKQAEQHSAQIKSHKINTEGNQQEILNSARLGQCDSCDGKHPRNTCKLKMLFVLIVIGRDI